MTDDPRKVVLQHLVATSELMATNMSREALALMTGDLLDMAGVNDVIEALKRTRREHQGRLTLASVVSRLPGRMSADEAWEKAMAHRIWDEDATLVLPNVILRSFPHSLWNEGDRVASRRAFIDRFATEARKADAWDVEASWGFDVQGRENAIAEARKRGLLPAPDEVTMLPSKRASGTTSREAMANHMRQTVERLRDRPKEGPSIGHYQEGEIRPTDDGLPDVTSQDRTRQDGTGRDRTDTK